MTIPGQEPRPGLEIKKPKLTVVFEGRNCTITSDAMENPVWQDAHKLTELLGVDKWIVLDDGFKIKISKKYLEGNLSESDKEKVLNALKEIFTQGYDLNQE